MKTVFVIFGSILGGVLTFIGYWAVFICTDIIDNYDKVSDVPESFLLVGSLIAGAFLGGVVGLLLSLTLGRRQAQKAKQQ